MSYDAFKDLIKQFVEEIMLNYLSKLNLLEIKKCSCIVKNNLPIKIRGYYNYYENRIVINEEIGQALKAFRMQYKVKAKDVENPVEPSEPTEPSKPIEPGKPSGNSDKNQNVNTGNKPTNNKNQLPKTGGVPSSILLAIGALLVGVGKKKLQ